MSENSYVIVIPSKFAQKESSLLLENIKKILKIKNQKFNSIGAYLRSTPKHPGKNLPP